jgi:hypothetical protein
MAISKSDAQAREIQTAAPLSAAPTGKCRTRAIRRVPRFGENSVLRARRITSLIGDAISLAVKKQEIGRIPWLCPHRSTKQVWLAGGGRGTVIQHSPSFRRTTSAYSAPGVNRKIIVISGALTAVKPPLAALTHLANAGKPFV